VVIRGKNIRTKNDPAKNYLPPGKTNIEPRILWRRIIQAKNYLNEAFPSKEFSGRSKLQRRIIRAKNHMDEECSDKEFSALTKK
jgi:hypothetical protein